MIGTLRYGALLNEIFRLSDERMGKSTTLTGRSIVRHMTAEVNKSATGAYDYLGETVRYNDTDSCYFTIHKLMKEQGIELTKEEYIEIYKQFADEANDSFPEFMHNTFNTGIERGSIIKTSLELVASKVLFIKKKKYGCLKYWDEDNGRLDKDGSPGKLKVMGLDLKRADTPKYMQTFLEGLLKDILQGVDENNIMSQIKEFRKTFRTKDPWDMGSPKVVKNLTKYGNIMDKSDKMDLLGFRAPTDKAKSSIPGHVRASVNWNKMRESVNDKHTLPISDGTRIVVCKLLKNLYNIDSIAYPIDEPHLPVWFKELPFDKVEMENVIIDKKVMNLIGVLDWDMSKSREQAAEEFFIFE